MRHQLFLCEELQVEILSWLPVKSLVKFRCVSKTWKSLISDSQFVKLHLHRSSSRNTDFSQAYLLIREFAMHDGILDQEYVVYPSISSLLEGHSAVVAIQSCVHMYEFIGSCNGLISLKKEDYENATEKLIYHVYIWNPATRLKSQPSPPLYDDDVYNDFGFGYDCSSDTYKVVAVTLFGKTMVNVYNMGDNCWRRIQVSPLPSLYLKRDAVYVSNTLNWLTFRPSTNIMYGAELINIALYTIVSFDLGKEELTQFSLPPLPQRKDKFQASSELILEVLRGFLSISQYDKKTHNFVIWQMKEFGVNKSWTQMFNIIGCKKIIKQPCSTCMFENGNVLLFAEYFSQAALYTKRENKLEGLRVSNNFLGCQSCQKLY